MSSVELRVPADAHAPRRVRAELKPWLAARAWPGTEAGDILMSISEAVSNAAEHAYATTGQAQPAAPVVSVTVTELILANSRRVEAIVRDSGIWRPEPPDPKFRGRGIRMMSVLMTSCEIDRDESGTTITMISKPVRAHDPIAGVSRVDVQPEPAQDVAHGSGERMRWLEAITDTGLAHLSVDRLLDELLEKVRVLLDVDTAAVLLLDPSRQFLIAAAARGLEEEVHQGVRIPLGQGFAGRIADRRRPVAIAQVDHDNVLNPILREKGIVSLLGVPLMANGAVIGVLHVGTLTQREFTAHDADLLQMAADRVALSTHSRMSSAERAAASVMQRNLLPAALPKVPGFEFASRYVTGGEGDVGGDWYDVFTLPSGKVCLLVGDSMGHGLEAAQSMSQLRSALRAYALGTDDPAELLAKLDHYVTRFQPGTLVTVICGMLDPAEQLLRMSSAGHPPPILARPAQDTVTLELQSDLVLGVEPGHPRHSTDVPLPPGSVLCLYSDGLVERRRVLVDDNIEKLRKVVIAQPAEGVCVEVMRQMVGTATPEDDVAVLVIRRLPTQPIGDGVQQS